MHVFLNHLEAARNKRFSSFNVSKNFFQRLYLMDSEMCCLRLTHCLSGSGGPPVEQSHKSIAAFAAYYCLNIFLMCVFLLNSPPGSCTSDLLAVSEQHSGMGPTHKQLHCALYPPVKVPVFAILSCWETFCPPPPPVHTDQKGAEEDEGHKVEVGKVAAALLPCVSWELIAGTVTEARQHDLVPRLACCAPEEAKQSARFWSSHGDNWGSGGGGATSPEEEGQGLPEVLEVVVMIYRCLVAQLNVSEHLGRAQGWIRFSEAKKIAVNVLTCKHISVPNVKLSIYNFLSEWSFTLRRNNKVNCILKWKWQEDGYI